MIQSDAKLEPSLGGVTPAKRAAKELEDLSINIVKEMKIANVVKLMKQQISEWKERSSAEKGKGGKHSKCESCGKDCKATPNAAIFVRNPNI